MRCAQYNDHLRKYPVILWNNCVWHYSIVIIIIISYSDPLLNYPNIKTAP